MQSLESKIRDLMLEISAEQDEINRLIILTYNRDKIRDLSQREEHLSRLSSLCLITIDKEIDFFKNN